MTIGCALFVVAWSMSRSTTPRGIATAPGIVPRACSSRSRTSTSVNASPDCCIRFKSPTLISWISRFAPSTNCLNSGRTISLPRVEHSSGRLRPGQIARRISFHSLLLWKPRRMSTSSKNAVQPSIDSFLLEVADVVNTTLDLDTLLTRVSELVRKIIDYDIFAILLVNEKAQELRIRFQVGHPPEAADRMRIKIGEGITGLAAQRREPVLVNDVSKQPEYISSVSAVRSELAIPMITKNKVIGVIDIEAPQPNYFTEEHSRLLTVIASRVAIGVENARLYTRVSNQAKSLLLLNETSRELTSILNLDQLLKRVGDLLTRVIDYQMFSILLIDNSGEKLQHRFSLRFKENIHLKHDIPLGRGLVGYAVEHNEAVLVPDVKKDDRYIMLNPETRSELAVPLVYKGKVIGVLDLEHTRRGYFTEEHKRTLTTLAAQIAIAIENARLYEQIVRQEKRLEQDLALARELQHRLLPATLPKMNHAEVAAKFSPARAIGGDLYDFLKYSGGYLHAIAVGDVSGKGA